MADYNYDEYLARWKKLFGEEPEGDYEYTQFGDKMQCKLKKLSKKEFKSKQLALGKMQRNYEKYEADGDPRKDDCLDTCLSFEIQLLLLVHFD